jgi:hypothetical protein
MTLFRSRRAKRNAVSVTDNYGDFVEDAVRGSARRQIKISEMADLCMALMSGLQRQGALDEQQLKERLHGVCPKCGVRLKGEGIMMIAMLKRAEHPAFGSGSTQMERVFQGKCANEDCRSKEIIIEWDG